MSLRSGYDEWYGWRQAADPDHDDSVSPGYGLLGEYLGEVRGARRPGSGLRSRRVDSQIGAGRGSSNRLRLFRCCSSFVMSRKP
jgi:hypothetical protein